jgi:hypothetical protein
MHAPALVVLPDDNMYLAPRNDLERISIEPSASSRVTHSIPAAHNSLHPAASQAGARARPSPRAVECVPERQRMYQVSFGVKEDDICRRWVCLLSTGLSMDGVHEVRYESCSASRASPYRAIGSAPPSHTFLPPYLSTPNTAPIPPCRWMHALSNTHIIHLIPAHNPRERRAPPLGPPRDRLA